MCEIGDVYQVEILCRINFSKGYCQNCQSEFESRVAAASVPLSAMVKPLQESVARMLLLFLTYITIRRQLYCPRGSVNNIYTYFARSLMKARLLYTVHLSINIRGVSRRKQSQCMFKTDSTLTLKNTKGYQ